MPTIEIDESELTGLKNATGTLSLLLSNPKTRSTVLNAVKTIRPDVVIPEVDAAQPFAAALGEIQKSQAELREEIKKDREEREHAKKMADLTTKFEKGRDTLRAQGWQADGITKIEELMEKEGIANHEAAAAYFERLNPPATPLVGGSSQPLALQALDSGARENSEYLKKLFEGDMSDATLMGEVNAALREARGR